MNMNMDPNASSPWFTAPPGPDAAAGGFAGAARPPAGFQSPPGSSGRGVSGAMGSAYASGGGSGGYYASGTGGGAIGADDDSGGEDEFADEPPLLEELGIHFEHIWAKTQSVLLPNKQINEHILDDADLAGPLVFCFVFGVCLLLVRLSRSLAGASFCMHLRL
jgi:hypothetical protein